MRLTKLPLRLDPARFFSWDYAYEAESVWCKKCRDFLPWTDEYQLCDHVHWCDTCDWWGGPGADEPCSHETAEVD
jgi:hypothetical protein